MPDSIFDAPFDFFALLIAVIAFIVALRSRNQIDALRARLDALEAAGETAMRAAPPPLPYEPAAEPPPLAPAVNVVPEPPPIAPEAAAAETEAEAVPQDAAPPPLAPAQPGFEETIGTRWVVWIGGLTLALGGFFLVRYSIEAGLIGLLANFAGIALGFALSLILIFVINKQSFGWTIRFHWPVAVLLGALTVVYAATVLAGLYPARVAVRLNPVEVVHEE